MSDDKKTSRSDERKPMQIFRIVFTVLFIAALAGCGWFFYQYWQARSELAVLKDPAKQQEQAKKEAAELVSQVEKLMLLPEEDPVVATVVDVENLKKDQPFYEQAQNGDKVLVYPQAQKAIIYRPERKIIVNVGPIYVEPNKDDAAQAAVPVPSVLTLDVRNGSPTPGKAASVADRLKAEGNYEVQKVENAARSDYGKTVIVNLKGKDVRSLEEELGIKSILDLPEGEVASSADVLIIVGAE